MQRYVAQLRPYQRAGVGRLIELVGRRGGAILADEPGLGKTAQTAEYINRTKPTGPVLVVCPASLRLNWKRELARWMTWEPFSVDIVSYEAVASGKVVLSSRYTAYSLIVFDEAHYLKNPSAKRTRACLALKAEARLFLTGTPVVNRPMDLFPILKALGLKLSRTEYGKRYCAGRLVQIGWKPRKFAWDFSGASRLEELGRVLREQCLIRRTKAEVLTELPAKIRQVLELELPAYQEPESLRRAVSRYFEGLEQAAADLPELQRVAFTELSAARLELARQKLPCVVSFLKDLLEEEEKVVVFAHHREVVEELAAAVPGAVKLYGGMTDSRKAEAVTAFQSGPAPVFVGQLTAAGTGLTLTAARTVLFAELDWVPGNVTQAEDRCHRLGQRDVVRVIHLVARDSVDARMVRALVAKQEVIERVMA